MGTQELAPQHNPFEFTSVIKSIGLKKQVEEIIFASHANELEQLSEIDHLPVQRLDIEFNLRKVMTGIYRFSAIDLIGGKEDLVTVTQNLVEVKTVDLDSEKKVRHLWNNQEALDRVTTLLEKFSPSSTSHYQQVLFEA